jgi:hypothetical protein
MRQPCLRTVACLAFLLPAFFNRPEGNAGPVAIEAREKRRSLPAVRGQLPVWLPVTTSHITQRTDTAVEQGFELLGKLLRLPMSRRLGA